MYCFFLSYFKSKKCFAHYVIKIRFLSKNQSLDQNSFLDKILDWDQISILGSSSIFVTKIQFLDKNPLLAQNIIWDQKSNFGSKSIFGSLEHSESNFYFEFVRPLAVIFTKNWTSKLIFTYSLDALDTEASVEADDDSQWHHDYVNVAPPRPPKFKMAERAVRQEGPAMPSRRSTPVYVNVYSLGRRRPGDVLQSGRWVTTQNSGGENFGQPSCLNIF